MVRTAALGGALFLLFGTPGAAAPLRVSGWVIEPLGRAAGSVRIEISPTFPQGAGEQPVDAARPGFGGSFELEVPAPGLYRVNVWADGFLPLTLMSLPVVEDLVLAPVSMEPALSLDVSVAGPDGRPAAGVAVCARSWTARAWAPAERCGTSSATGSVVLPRGRSERPFLFATDPRFAPQLVEAGDGSAATIRLAAARTVSLDVRGPDGKPAAGVQARIGLSPAGVTDPAGRLSVAVPESGTEVELRRAGGTWARVVFRPGEHDPRRVFLQPPRPLTGRVRDSVTLTPLADALVWSGEAASLTAADGSFVLAIGSGPGLTVEAAAAGHSRRLSALPQDARSVILDLPPAVPRDERISSSDLDHRSGIEALQGFEISGWVLGPEGAPVPGSCVVLLGDDPMEHRLRAAARDGSFVLAGAPDGVYRLAALAPGFAQLAPRELQVAGRPVRGLDLRLGRAGSIGGGLTGLEREELEGLVIVARPSSEGSEEDFRGAPPRRLGIVDSAGRYRIPDVPPGRWEVTARTESGRRALGWADVLPRGGEAVLDLRFTSGLTLSGGLRVDGQTAAGWVLAVSPAGDPEGGGGQGLAGDDGAFSLPGLEPGIYLLLALVNGSLWPAETVELTADRVTTLDFLTGTVSGRVLGPDGVPVAGAGVTLQPRASGFDAFLPSPQVHTDALGLFRLPRIPGGNHRLVVTQEHAAPFEMAITVPPGETVPVEISLQPDMRDDR